MSLSAQFTQNKLQELQELSSFIRILAHNPNHAFVQKSTKITLIPTFYKFYNNHKNFYNQCAMQKSQEYARILKNSPRFSINTKNTQV